MPAVFKMDLAISQNEQGRCATYSYVVASILLMLGIYIFATIITLLGLTEDFYGVCAALYIGYIIMSCCTDT